MYRKSITFILVSAMLLTGCGSSANTISTMSTASSSDSISNLSISSASISVSDDTSANEGNKTQTTESASSEITASVPNESAASFPDISPDDISTADPDDAPTVDESADISNIDSFITLSTYKGLVTNYSDDTSISEGMMVTYEITLESTGGSGTMDGFTHRAGDSSDTNVIDSDFIGRKKGDEFASSKNSEKIRITQVSKLDYYNAFLYLCSQSKVIQYPSDLINFYLEDEKKWKNPPTDEEIADDSKQMTKLALVGIALMKADGCTEGTADYQTISNNVTNVYGWADETDAVAAGASATEYHLCFYMEAAYYILNQNARTIPAP